MNYIHVQYSRKNFNDSTGILLSSWWTYPIYCKPPCFVLGSSSKSAESTDMYKKLISYWVPVSFSGDDPALKNRSRRCLCNLSFTAWFLTCFQAIFHNWQFNSFLDLTNIEENNCTVQCTSHFWHLINKPGLRSNLYCSMGWGFIVPFLSFYWSSHWWNRSKNLCFLNRTCFIQRVTSIATIFPGNRRRTNSMTTNTSCPSTRGHTRPSIR